MNECTTCNVCEQPSSFSQATEVRQVRSHVRCFSSEFFTVWRCTNCGSLHSKENADLPRYYAAYPFRNHRLDYHSKHGYRNRLRLLKQAGVTPQSSVLDYGCGQGVYVEFLRQEGFEQAFGYDPYIARFSDKEVLARKFDVVTSHDVIEHVDDPKAYLATLISMVRPGGLLVIGTPNADEIHITEGHPDAVELSQPYHRHILSEGALLSMAKQHGLKAQNIYRRFYFDTLMPSVNTRFMWTYVELNDGIIDVCMEPPNMRTILTSPRLLFYAFFGYFYRVPGNILITFKLDQSSILNASSELGFAA